MSDVAMQYDSVTGLAKRINQLNDDFKNACDGIDSVIEALDEKWDGSASNEFMKAYKKIKPKLKAVSTLLNNYDKALNSTVESQKITDKTSSGNFNPF